MWREGEDQEKENDQGQLRIDEHLCAEMNSNVPLLEIPIPYEMALIIKIMSTIKGMRDEKRCTV